MLFALAVSVGFFSFTLILRQNPAHIAVTSPLIENIRRFLPLGTTYAVAPQGLSLYFKKASLSKTIASFLINAFLDLFSVHSYNSPSPKRYHHLLNQLGGEVLYFGRYNDHINPDYDSTVFWMTNIGLMLSPHPLTHPHLQFKPKVSGVYMYRVDSRMGKALQIVSSFPLATNGDLKIDDPRQWKLSSLIKSSSFIKSSKYGVR